MLKPMNFGMFCMFLLYFAMFCYVKEPCKPQRMGEPSGNLKRPSLAPPVRIMGKTEAPAMHRWAENHSKI